MLIDIHSHIGRLSPDRREFVDATNLIAKMDVWGIDRSIVLAASESPECPVLEVYTNDVVAACARYPDRLIPFCMIDPRYGNRADMDFTPLMEEYKSRGCRGIGEVVAKLEFDDPRCLNLYRQAGKLGLPVLFHLEDRAENYGLRDTPGLPGMEHALRECPHTAFIGHGPTFWAEISGGLSATDRGCWPYPVGLVKPGGAVPRLMRQYPNLWGDVSANSGHNALTRDPAFGLEFMEEFQDRLLFGTDSCKRSDVDSILNTVAFFRDLRDSHKLPPEALEKIGWKNVAGLLHLNVAGSGS